MHLRFLMVLFLALAAFTADAEAEGCRACRGSGTAKIKRDSSYAKVREAQDEVGMWCNVCAALGLYDEETEEGPCPECSLKGTADAPSAAASALDVHVKEWWGEHDEGQTIFIATKLATLSTDFEDLILKKDAGPFARQRKQISRLAVGRGIGRGAVMSWHERAHLWIQRIEDCYYFCNDTTGIEDDQAESMHKAHFLFNVILFKDGSDDGTLNQQLGQLYRRGDGNVNFTPVSSGVGSDDDGWTRMMHNIGHIWVERLYGGNTQKGVQGWLISGMKLHTQIYFNAGVSQSVATEVSTSRGVGGPKRFRESICKDVQKQKADFVGMLAKNWEAMSIDDQMLSWSLVDFLTNHSRPKFKALLDGLVTEQLGFAEALRNSHKWTPGMLEAAWVSYVLQAYRGDERKTLPVRGYER